MSNNICDLNNFSNTIDAINCDFPCDGNFIERDFPYLNNIFKEILFLNAGETVSYSIGKFVAGGVEYLQSPYSISYDINSVSILTVSGQNYISNLVDGLNVFNAGNNNYLTFHYHQAGDAQPESIRIKFPACQDFCIQIIRDSDGTVYEYSNTGTSIDGVPFTDYPYPSNEVLSNPCDCADTVSNCTYSFDACLPTIRVCTEPKNNICLPCNDGCINSNKIPFLQCDKIKLQFGFVDYRNPDWTNPIGGWGDLTITENFINAVVCDKDGNKLDCNLDDFADCYYVAVTDTEPQYSYQFICIDPYKIYDKTGIGCFVIMIQYRNEFGDIIEYFSDFAGCSLVFEYVGEYIKAGKKDFATVVISSEVSNSTCNENIYYGEPVNAVGSFGENDDCVYSNEFRFLGCLSKDIITPTKEYTTRNKLTKSTIENSYTLKLDKMPEWMVEKLAEVITGDNVNIYYEWGTTKYSFTIKEIGPITKNENDSAWCSSIQITEAECEYKINC